MDFLCRAALGARAGERPISVALYGSRASAFAPSLGQALVEAGQTRFHVECLGASSEVARAARREARELGVAGYLTLLTPEDHIPRREPGTYDFLFSMDLLHRAEGREELLAAVDGAMTKGSVLIVDEPIGNPLAEAVEAEAIVDFLCGKLLPRHRSRWEPDAARAAPHDNGLLAALAERFAVVECSPFGGIADPFLDPATGLVFSTKNPEDLRFVDFVGDLELRLRDSLSPTRVIARLGKAGTARKQARFPRTERRSETRLEIPEEVWFDFAAAEEVFSHVLDGLHDRPVTVAGFHEWELENELRWAGPVFTLRATLPTFDDPMRCRFVVECHEPNIDVEGGVTLFVDGARAGRIEDVYARLHTDAELVCEAITQGGPVNVTCVFDRSQKLPDPVDDRELGVAVRRFSASVVWRTESIP